jgi:hypothetical protein
MEVRVFPGEHFIIKHFKFGLKMLKIRNNYKDITEKFIEQQGVIYKPKHNTNNNIEFGYVSSKNHKCVFVKFEKQLTNFGWDNTTSMGCDPKDLIPIDLWWGDKNCLNELRNFRLKFKASK